MTLASEPLRQFLQAARSAGMRVSAAEGIDAARAVQVVGFSDRTVLKDTLSLVLAKTPDEKHLFDECFDLYFRRDALAQEDEAGNGRANARGARRVWRRRHRRWRWPVAVADAAG